MPMGERIEEENKKREERAKEMLGQLPEIPKDNVSSLESALEEAREDVKRLRKMRREGRGLGEIFEDADLVFAVGTRFQNYATRVWTLPMPENLIHVDVDPGVIGRNYSASVAVVGDAKLALQGMLDRIDNGNVDEQFVDRCRKIRTADEQAIQEEIGADHSQIVSIIRRLLPDACPVVRDSTVPGYTWGCLLYTSPSPRD